jgi:hypothetical protein
VDRSLLDRWTDTTIYGVVLARSSVLVFPVLGAGVIVSFWMIGAALVERTAEFVGGVIVVLTVGGAAGILGWLRARHQMTSPDSLSITATVVFLSVGIATALAVGAIVAIPLSAAMMEPWGVAVDAWPGLLFPVANTVWALHGIGWIQRLTRRYAQQVRRPFDGMPAVALVITIALALAAALAMTTL